VPRLQEDDRRQEIRGPAVSAPGVPWRSLAQENPYFSGLKISPKSGSSFRVLAHLIEHGDCEELDETIKRQGRHIERLRSRRPRARSH
jgi:hypothetical protein